VAGGSLFGASLATTGVASATPSCVDLADHGVGNLGDPGNGGNHHNESQGVGNHGDPGNGVGHYCPHE